VSEPGWPVWSLSRVLAGRPAIRVNQVGYLPRARKCATWISSATEPVAFEIRAEDGVTVSEGRSTPWPERPEPTSGQTVHVIDFSVITRPGKGYRIQAGDDESHPFRIAADVYDDLWRDALRLFYLLRSGCPISDERAPGQARPAGHSGRSPNRGDTAVPAWSGPDAARLYPGWRPSGVFDVSGGWYDAGDYGKYVVSGSFALWQLLGVVDLFRRLGSPASDKDGERTVIEECRWELDWLLRMQVPADQPLAGMAFHRVHGTEWSPIPGWAHQDPTVRVLHRPSTAATLHLAAAAAMGARLLRPADAAYADNLLMAARTAYDAADAHPDLIAPDDAGQFGGGPYGDTDVDDDFYWAAAELWLATDEDLYRSDVLASKCHTADVFTADGYDFDAVAGPARLDLATAGHCLPGHWQVRQSVRQGAERLLALQRAQPWGQPYAPESGWAWGSNGRILNNLVVLAVAHQITGDPRFLDGAVTGMDYLLGRNALGQSYVTGYGTDTTAHLRTRQFGHDSDQNFPPPPIGALAGGANSTNTPGFASDPRLDGLAAQCRYLDEPTSETTNDICIRWNAPLTYVASYLSLTAASSFSTTS
jgi:endoglucanase